MLSPEWMDKSEHERTLVHDENCTIAKLFTCEPIEIIMYTDDKSHA